MKAGKLILFIVIWLSACSSQPENMDNINLHYQQLSTKEPSNFQQTDNQVKEELEQESKSIEQEEQPNAPMLPFQDFRERWNAITDEQMSNLYIRNLEEHSNNDETIYRAQLNDYIEMRIHIYEKSIIKLEMISKEKSQAAIFTMLSGWSQIVTIIHQNREIPDVDAFFNKIGVGPNGNLTNINTGAFTYFDIVYEVIQTDQGFIFRAVKSQKDI